MAPQRVIYDTITVVPYSAVNRRRVPAPKPPGIPSLHSQLKVVQKYVWTDLSFAQDESDNPKTSLYLFVSNKLHEKYLDAIVPSTTARCCQG